MKHKTLIQLRDEDFADCLRTVVHRYDKQSTRPSQSTIIAEALASRPRRYYLSYQTIVSNLSRLRRKNLPRADRDKNDTRQREQWTDINRAVDRYIALHKGATVSEAITYVVNFARPERFYISEKKALELFRRTLRREYRFIG